MQAEGSGHGASTVSLRRRAWEGVAQVIRSGGYHAGDRLPPERELAHTLEVSRSTLRLAFHDLERSGLIVRRPGRGGGTFVAAPKVERNLGQFTGLAEYIRRQGLDAGARVISVVVTTSNTETSEALEIHQGDPVVEIARVRLASGEPLALERSRFPANRFPGLAERPLGGSLYELLRDHYGEAPQRALERLEPVAAQPGDAALLSVAPGTPLLAAERITYGVTGEPVEYAHDLFRGDRTRVVVWTSSDDVAEQHERRDE